MIKRAYGFTLIELLVVMGIFVLIIGITGSIFNVLLKRSKQEGRVSETQIESIMGLELLRVDLEHAGYGLAWSFQNPLNYLEASTAKPYGCTDGADKYNDSGNTPNTPRAVVGGYKECLNNSDYLVIKSTVSGLSGASQRWTYITNTGSPKAWGTDDLVNTDRVIAIRPIPGEIGFKQLLMTGGNFSTQLSNIANLSVQTNDVLYGVSSTNDLRMPFNRADYYISAKSVPSNCAPNTGVLQKVTINHGDGTQLNPPLPLLDCVADMKVIYRLDMNGDGTIGTSANADGSSVSSAEGVTTTAVQGTLDNPDLLRQRLREIRIYVLAHEGQRDTSYTHSTQKITYGDEVGIGTEFDLKDKIGTNWQNYRWKVYMLVVKPKNLMEIGR